MSKRNHLNALSTDEARSAYRVGTARALADLGMTPSEAEWALKVARASVDLSKQADGPNNFFQTGFDALEGIGMGSLVVGGVLGAASGHLRHQFENTVDGSGNPQDDELKRKIEGYRKMKRELATAQTAGLTD